MVTRRDVLRTSLSVAAGGVLLGRRARAAEPAPAPRTRRRSPDGLAARRAGARLPPVVVPNGATLPWRIVDGVKVVTSRSPSRRARDRAGARDRRLGLQRPHARTGDRSRLRRSLRIYVTNRLPSRPACTGTASCSRCGMDGVRA